MAYGLQPKYRMKVQQQQKTPILNVRVYRTLSLWPMCYVERYMGPVPLTTKRSSAFFCSLLWWAFVILMFPAACKWLPKHTIRIGFCSTLSDLSFYSPIWMFVGVTPAYVSAATPLAPIVSCTNFLPLKPSNTNVVTLPLQLLLPLSNL